jgi:hypothetical protein
MARLPAPCWALVMCRRSRVRAVAVSADCLAARTAHCKLIRQPGASGGASPRGLRRVAAIRRPATRARHQLPLLHDARVFDEYLLLTLVLSASLV